MPVSSHSERRDEKQRIESYLKAQLRFEIGLTYHPGIFDQIGRNMQLRKISGFSHAAFDHRLVLPLKCMSMKFQGESQPEAAVHPDALFAGTLPV